MGSCPVRILRHSAKRCFPSVVLRFAGIRDIRGCEIIGLLEATGGQPASFNATIPETGQRLLMTNFTATCTAIVINPTTGMLGRGRPS